MSSEIPNVIDIVAWKARRAAEAEKARALENEKRTQSYIESDALLNFNVEDLPSDHLPESDKFVVRPEKE